MKIEVYSPTIRRKEMDAVLTVMVEDKIGPGEQARLLIQIAKEHLHFDYCLALRSPAIALYLALKALNLEDGQGVIVSALSPRYYARVIEDLRLKLIYCDVLSSSPLIGRETIEAAIAKKADGVNPRCIVAHHTLGFVPDIAAIAELGLPVIDDQSQSYGFIAGGNETEGKEGEPDRPSKAAENPGGVSGVFTILGLEERDMLTAGGGALLYAANRRDGSVLRNFGDLPPEYNLPDINAAMGVIQFREAAKNLEKRGEIARVYAQSALRTRHKRFIQETGEYNNYAFPLILETGLKDVKAYARKKDVIVESAFDDTLTGTLSETSRGSSGETESGGISLEAGLCPEAYSLSLRTVLFPLYPRLSSLEVERISKLILTLP
jgi:dTDP-4-amino-4,6-dideoxygalactose transaminase